MRFFFGDHVLDEGRGELTRGGVRVELQPQVFDLLLHLVRNRERMVSKDDMLEAIWRGRIVSESALTTRINAARKAIGDSGKAQGMIRTVPRKGFRFIADVREEANSHMSGKAAPQLALPSKPSLVVLPFQNMSGDPEQEYFADGMVEEITAALSRVKSFFVIARNTSFTYKGKAVDVKQVGHELGVLYVLEGSVRKAQDRVRITAQLISATTGNHIWSDRYDGGIKDIFDLQDRITENVVGAIQPSILLAEIERTKRKRPESLDAYDCVLRAFPHVWAFDPVANTTALNHLSEAIETEPDYRLALSMAAWCQARRAVYNWTPALAEARAEGLRLAKLAGNMDNDDPLVLTMLCAAHSAAVDLEVASALIEKALTLDPNSSMAWNRSGWLNTNLSRPEIAIEHFQRALRLSPLDPMNFNCFFGIGVAHFISERYEEALSWIRKCMVAHPGSDFPLRALAACLGLLGRTPEAREVIRQYRQVAPDATISKVMAITPYRDAEFRRRYAEGLRKAGLPE